MMKRFNLANLTLIALTASCLIQVGAQLFAISVVASTVAEAPPRSFAILEGEYRYDSGAFWDIVPNITTVLFVLALIANWKNPRRKPILVALTLFIIGGFAAVFFLEPLFADMIARGYSDQIDPVLLKQAQKWYLIDCMVWVLGLVSGLVLLSALARTAPHEK
ncbi:MAG: hypothetical protein JNK10_11395 [Cyclobacteriaceae bacterium]|nr:hypothetical protein [Cyclobacteriaceae bacterium]